MSHRKDANNITPWPGPVNQPALPVEARAGRQGPPEPAPEEGGLIGRCPVMEKVQQAIARAAPHKVDVLILGESGTGKDVVARRLHALSPRSPRPFVPVNCAGIPEGLVEGELLGHERGAYTGADRQQRGKFEQADGGTLFLDEVGDMPVPVQPKVLRLLEGQPFERLGGSVTVQADVRLIAATHQELGRLVAAGAFREDLYHRLRHFVIQLPPLRQRPDDLPLLVENFVQLFNRRFGRAVTGLDAETWRRFRAHAWPGNVRELRAVLEHAVLCADGDTVTPTCLPEDFGTAALAADQGPAPAVAGVFDVEAFVRDSIEAGEADVYRKLHEVVDGIALAVTLAARGGSIREAARALGLARNTFREKLRSGKTLAPGGPRMKQPRPAAKSGETPRSKTDPGRRKN
jgi:two-component system nitrogen regulation response regulator GlnG